MQPDLRPRLMTAADLPACDELRSLAGWNQTMRDWEQFLAAQPDGCFVVEEHGRAIGAVTTASYQSALAWIGMMLVHPAERRRGVGRSLMEHCLKFLDDRGVRCVKLDATSVGQPLYEQLGFATEWTLTRRARTESESRLPNTATLCRDFDISDFNQLVELDTAAFGVPRAELLGRLVKRSERVVVVETNGKLAGFGMLRSGARAQYLGPVVAVSSESAQPIVNELLITAGSKSIFWDIPDLNADAVRLSVACGFEQARRLTRMTRGEHHVVHQPQRIFGIADPALG